jgi:hypothetical protein
MPTAIVLFGLFGTIYDWTSERIVEVYALVAACSAVGAWIGLVRARTSPSSLFKSPLSAAIPADEVIVTHSKKGFRSPQSAQFWLEWRRQGRTLPIATLFGLFAMSLPLFFSSEMDFFQGSTNTRVNIWMNSAIAYLPWIPLLFATAIGMGARESDVRGSEGVYDLFYATRPLGESEMYVAKIRAITAGVLLTALMTIATMLMWLWIPATLSNGASKPYALILFSTFDRQAFRIMTGIGAVLICWTLRNQIVGAFVDYLPSKKYANLYPFIVILSGVSLYMVFGVAEQLLDPQTRKMAVVVALSTLLVAKIGVAVLAAYKLKTLRQSYYLEITKAFAGWLVLALVFATAFGTIASVMPDYTFPSYYRNPAPELFGILLVPLARPFVARLALELGRHR